MKTSALLQRRSIAVPVLARLLALLALGSAVLFATAAPSHAAGPRALSFSDFGGAIGARDVSGTADAVVAEVRYARAISLGANGAYLTYYTHQIPGYAALSFALGIADSALGNSCQAAIELDGKVVRTVTARAGLVARQETVAFGAASKITILVTLKYAPCWLLIGTPTLLPAAAAVQRQAHRPVGGSTALQLFSGTVAAGGQETALVTTGPAAEVTLVVGYPDGSQAVMGPRRAGVDGHAAYSWAVPAGERGTVRVVAVSLGVAQATFSIR